MKPIAHGYFVSISNTKDTHSVRNRKRLNEEIKDLRGDRSIVPTSNLESLFPGVFLIFGALFLAYLGYPRRSRPKKRVLTDAGYVRLGKNGLLEHRVVAEQCLRRKLEPDEVVHHINGNTVDNTPKNLCVLTDEAHDDFHDWLTWKREKEGHYPNLKYQRIVLKDRHGGILVDESNPSSKSE